LLEAISTDNNLGVTRGGSLLRMRVVDEHILVVSEGVLFVTEMQSPVVSEVLSITRRRKHYSVRNVDLRRDSLDVGVVHNLAWCGLESAVSDLQVAHVGVGEAAASQLRIGSSGDGTNFRAGDGLNARVRVVRELNFRFRVLKAVQGD